MFDSGKPIPEELREAIKEETVLKDWIVECEKEGNKCSGYTIRDIVNGANIYEKSYSTLERIIRLAITRADETIARKEKSKSTLKVYNRLNQITA